MSRSTDTNTNLTSSTNNASPRSPSFASGSDSLVERQGTDQFEGLRHLHSKILVEMKSQLPSLECDEAFGLAWQVTKQLYDWVADGSNISSLSFRRTHLQDTLSSAWITILDFVCSASCATSDNTVSDNSSRPTRGKDCKGVAGISQQSGEHPHTLYITDLSKPGHPQRSAAVGERDYLKAGLSQRGSNTSQLLDRHLYATLKITHCTGDWKDPHILAGEQVPLEKTIAAELKRICAWGLVTEKVDYRLFSSYVQGYEYAPPISLRDEIGTPVEYNPQGLNFRTGALRPIQNYKDDSRSQITGSKHNHKDVSLEIIPTIQIKIPNGEIEFGIF